MNVRLSREELYALIQDAYRLAWCDGYAAHMATTLEGDEFSSASESSEDSFQANMHKLRSAQLITHADIDSRAPKQKVQHPVRIPGGYHHSLNG